MIFTKIFHGNINGKFLWSKIIVWFSGVFLLRRGKGTQGNMKSQQKPAGETWHSSTLSLLYREVHLGHCCLPSRQDPLGPPQDTLLIFSDTYTSREGIQTHSICWWFNCFQIHLMRCLSANLSLCCILRFGPSSWGPKISQWCKAEFHSHPLVLFILAMSSIQNTYLTFVLKTHLGHQVQVV